MKEPVGLKRLNRKRPDDLTLIPWQGGRPLLWNVTVISTLACSYDEASARAAGGAAEIAASRKLVKYTKLSAAHIFQPTAVETHGPLNASAVDFLVEVGRRLCCISGKERETSFLFQRLSILVQRSNAVLFHDCYACDDNMDL